MRVDISVGDRPGAAVDEQDWLGFRAQSDFFRVGGNAFGLDFANDKQSSRRSEAIRNLAVTAFADISTLLAFFIQSFNVPQIVRARADLLQFDQSFAGHDPNLSRL